ncbi:uncharacterized protein [Coffea arabica]|uniref:Tf2-1-like SH3-like domain-containing protein n=1 Tax=Coffea arabica TaxID=13443 RepID=A0ABM4VZ77_COFAR
MTRDHPKAWYSWLRLVECWYNTNFHSAIRTTPFQVVYGQAPPVHIPYIPGLAIVDAIDRSLATRERALHTLKHHLKNAQHRMKQLADKHRSDKEFKVGDLVYVKLQPYRQHFLKSSSYEKLSPRYFGPFPILE